MTGNYPQFRQPLRLLSCAVEYRKTQDPRILMNLPDEERTMLERLIGFCK
jgi:hypothetical protein